MESSVSEAGPESSQSSIEHLQILALLHAYNGTYIRNFYGCVLRFDQREGYRSAITVDVSAANVIHFARLTSQMRAQQSSH
jgi:hypothetical protein